MSELISGKEALKLVADGVVQYKCDKDPVADRWTTITDHFWDQYNLGVFLNNNTTWKFRLKPKTITISGIEVPVPFEPKGDCIVFILDDSKTGSYRAYNYEHDGDNISSFISMWESEEKIKQVVAALRSIFNAN